jgi:hypothetical protein
MSGTKSFNPDQFISGLTPADSSWGAMEKPSDEEILRIIRGPEQAGSSPSEPGVPGSPPK